LKHTLYAGGWSPEISRELFVRGSCVAVLLYDPHADKVVLIEQFRAGAILQPDRAWLVKLLRVQSKKVKLPRKSLTGSHWKKRAVKFRN